jgi:hypothetical protein
MNKNNVLGTLLIIVLSLSVTLNAQARDNKVCQSSAQTTTLAKIDSCIHPGDGSDPLSSANFNGAIAMIKQREFYVCLHETYQLNQANEASKVTWRDLFIQTSDYFKYDLSANRGHQSQRCGLAETLNKYVLIGQPK